MSKKSRQKFKYLENEKSSYDEIKSTFHHFRRAIIEAKSKEMFLEGESPPLTNPRGRTWVKLLQDKKHD